MLKLLHPKVLLLILIMLILPLFLGPKPAAAQEAAGATASAVAAPRADYNCNQVGEIPLDECRALVAIFLDNPGADWAGSGWLDNLTPCTWQGVTCEAGHVTVLSIQRGLSSAPDELALLTSLTNLDLSKNELTRVPAEMSALVNLRELDICQNKLTTLPSSLRNLTQLHDLDLSENELTSIPNDFGALENLTRLDLRHNKLTSTPENLGKMTKLRKLYLGYNQLTSVRSEELEPLVDLEELSLAGNMLEKLPTSLRVLTKLQILDASDNLLVKLQDSALISMTALINLDVSGNQLTYIPDEFENLVNLQTLDYSDNQLTAVANELGVLTALTSLDLSNNPQMVDMIPDSFVNLPLTSFNFTKTQLCEPVDAPFQSWIGAIGALARSGLTCNDQLIDFAEGAPGSFFTVVGHGFVADSTVAISVNGQNLGDVQVNASGDYTFTLSTAEASPGSYTVATNVGDGALTAFALRIDAPVQGQQGTGITFEVPAGIATRPIYLPFVAR
ncbi:MAG: leucine-rich repeat domain-containing protein [Caldilineaceae bacterium]